MVSENEIIHIAIILIIVWTGGCHENATCGDDGNRKVYLDIEYRRLYQLVFCDGFYEVVKDLFHEMSFSATARG